MFFFSCFQKQDNTMFSYSHVMDCYDFKYSYLDLDFSLLDKKIKGHNRMCFDSKCFLDVIYIDLFSNLHVDSVFVDGCEVSFSREDNQLLIEHDIRKGNKFFVDIFYQGNPVSSKNPPWDGGFVWTKDNNNLDWVGVACQKDGGRLWWPVKNDLADEPDSMRINISVEKPYLAISNGQLIDIKEDNNNKRHFEWLVTNPINNYNVTVNIANYKNFKDTLQGVAGILALDYYVLAYNVIQAKKHFQQVKPMLHTFEKLLVHTHFMKMVTDWWRPLI